MKHIIVLAAHGAPPRDFPRDEMAEFFNLHAVIESGRPASNQQITRYEALEARMRSWPRNSANDPFHAASIEFAESLERESGYEVIAGFNEFCGPDVTQAVERAIEKGADEVTIVTPMLTRGGEHAELEIARIAEKLQNQNPGVTVNYAWPYDTGDVSRFLSAQVARFRKTNDTAS